MFRVGFLIVALFIATPGSAFAKEWRQVGNIVFTPPADWRMSDIRPEGWARLSPSGDEALCKSCQIFVHIGSEPNGKFADWVAERMKIALGDKRLIERKPAESSSDPNLGKIVNIFQRVKGRREEIQIFSAFDAGDHWEMIHFSGSGKAGRDTVTTLLTFSQEYAKVLRSIRLISKGADPVLGEPVAGELDGIWFGRRVETSMGANFVMSMRIIPRIFSFWPDGRFYEGVPDTGFEGFDYDTAALSQTTETGNYTLEDGELVLDYADGDQKIMPHNELIFRDRDARLRRAQIAKDGYRFEGVISSFRYSPFSSGVSGGVAAASDMRFFKDGTFSGDKILSTTGSNFSTLSKSAKERGTYEISNGLIHLTAPNGVKKSWSFFLRDSEKGPQPVIRGKYLDEE